ncbi:MAG TPA: DRTGG domain-containing protein [Anaerolineales bacterium]|nr:DRTGG domain-containing protein [Anaerolineales bacterium]
MKSLYVTSVERFSGKTATCLALGKRFIADGYHIGYLKPLSLDPWWLSGRLADEDAVFAKEILNLPSEPWDLSTVVVTPQILRSQLQTTEPRDLMADVQAAAEREAAGKDILLLEGGGSLREGYVMGVPSPSVAHTLGSDVLAIVKYRDEVRLLDDALAAHTRLGSRLLGLLINRVSAEAEEFVTQTAIPYLEANGMPVFGVLPEVRALTALTVGELIDLLGAEVLTLEFDPEVLVENVTVGAMNADAALRRFRQQLNKGVITGGDRTDIQLAALETSTRALILTGNLRPSPLVVKQANEFGVPVLLVRSNTIETIEKIEATFGKTRLGQPVKLQQYEQLLNRHMDWGRFYAKLGLHK